MDEFLKQISADAQMDQTAAATDQFAMIVANFYKTINRAVSEPYHVLVLTRDFQRMHMTKALWPNDVPTFE